jgi:hypothetical protein
MKHVFLGSGLVLLAALGAAGSASIPARAATSAAVPDTFTVVSDSFTPAVVASDGSVTTPDRVTVVTDAAAGSTISTLDGDVRTSTGIDTTFHPVFTATSSPVSEPDGSATTTWTAQIPYSRTLSSAGVPLDNGYVVELTARWTDGGAASSATTPSPFDFDATSALRLSASNMDLTYGSASTTLSGKLTVTDPDGTPYTGSLSHEVRFTVGGQASETAIAASNGTFTGPTLTPAASESVVAANAGLPGVIPATTSNTIKLTVTDAVPEISIAASPVTETYGHYDPASNGTLSNTTVSGSMKIGSAPLANEQFDIRTAPTGGTVVVIGRTDSAGDFIGYYLPPETRGTRLYMVSGLGRDLAAAAAPFVVNVVHPTAVRSLSVKLDQSWDLSVRGCLSMSASPADSSEKIPSTANLMLEYSAHAGGPFKALASIPANESRSHCGVNGTWFTGTFGHAAPSPAAYYRVVYKGAVISGTGASGLTSLAGSASSAVYVWRYADRIVDAKTVKSGKRLTFSGTLQYYNKGWHDYSGQKMYVDLKRKGSSSWVLAAATMTNSAGNYRVTVTAPASAYWQVVFKGNNDGVGHLSTDTAISFIAL